MFPDRLRVGTAVPHLGGVQFPVTGLLRYTMTAEEAVGLGGLLVPRTVDSEPLRGVGTLRGGRSAIERAFAVAPDEIRESVEWIPIGGDLVLPA